MTVQPDDQLRALAFDAIASAWAALDAGDRENIIDLLSTYDNKLALQYLLDSDSIDPAVAGQIRDVINHPVNTG